MNERIKQLAEQCTDRHFSEGGGFETFDKEKFAELIVRECIDIVENQGAFMRYNHLAEQVRKHFGVKK
jgi:hypothetical protein